MSARRFVVGVSGSAGSLQALRYAAQLARRDAATLTAVLAWTPPGGDIAERRCPNPELRRLWRQAAWDRLNQSIDLAIGGPPADIEFSPVVVRGEAGQVLTAVLAWTPPGGDIAERRCPNPELRRLWRQAAWDRLSQSIDLAIGGPPADIEFSPVVVRGEAGQVLTEVAAQPDDVLVIGAGRHGLLHRLLGCRVSRYCLGHACCPLVAVPPSRLTDDMRGLRGWMLRRRVHSEKVGLRAVGV